tara:strand:- start:603 stop:788 length:186 start_codon:yes stop_codon:yes gene_type:complete
MKYSLTLFFFLLLVACTNKGIQSNDFDLKIDIYKKGITFEKFKKSVIEYAEKSTYPSLTNK